MKLNRRKQILEPTDMLGMSFEVKWCELCRTTYIECPRCKNNTCNGGSGEEEDGSKCQVCQIARGLADCIHALETSSNSSIHNILAKERG